MCLWHVATAVAQGELPLAAREGGLDRFRRKANPPSPTKQKDQSKRTGPFVFILLLPLYPIGICIN